MSRIERFEELIAWQKAKELAKQVYFATVGTRFSRDFGLTTQMQRAAVSVMSNIAEGFDRASRGEFHQFLSIAKGSCAELRSQGHLAYEIQYSTDDQDRMLLTMREEVARLVGGIRAAVQRKRDEAHG